VERRDDFAKKMWDADVDTNMVHIRNDVYKIFGGKRADLPVMNELEDKYTCLPLHMKITENDVYYICKKIKEGW
jgi:dTDP-4-amino-4,6-dideoxygalactose transaminase